MERLQKIIAQAGLASRRKAESMILEKRVKVNGTVVSVLGTKVSPKDKIEVDGVPIERDAPVYFLLYKPTGVISSAKDDKDRKTVVEFLPFVEERIFPVGRLDYDTSGAILLTNDGELANRLMHPKFHFEKEYVVKIKGIPEKRHLNAFKKGIRLKEFTTSPADIRIISVDRQKNHSVIQLVIHEGHNRQVRRMCEALGFEVLKLKRERYGFLDLKGLNPGDSRELKPHEVKQLYQESIQVK